MEKISNSKVPRQRDPIEIICGAHNTSQRYICIAKDGSAACDQGRHSFEPVQNWSCCEGKGNCDNTFCLAPRIARLM